jgi:hypothetical protein
VKFLREPLVHFLVIAAVIFVLYGLLGQQDAKEQERTITIFFFIPWLRSSKFFLITLSQFSLK